MLLALESSCDETAVALFDADGVLCASELSSQVDLHARWGGVVPELASRAHCEALPPMVERVLAAGGAAFKDVDAVAATVMPGLIGPLLVGVSYARTLSWVLGVPGLGVHHLEGHIYAPWSQQGAPEGPFGALVVSGGHTEILEVAAPGRFRRLACTRDDAAGEAFDKVAKMLGLGYPGGPVVDRLAARGDVKRWDFPRAMMGKGADLSFSGLKTAVRRHVELHGVPAQDSTEMADLCASVQEAIVDALLRKSWAALASAGLQRLVVTGGVAANSRLRALAVEEGGKRGVEVILPERRYCTDNAAMIGRAAWINRAAGLPALGLDARPSARLDRIYPA